MALEQEFLTSNLSGNVRRESFNGRDYLVAPITLIVPGVLNGSKGALYYPPDEVGRDPAAWNGMPLVVYHPTLADGTHVSGRDPLIIEKQGIGHVYRARIADKDSGKLVAEGWFDIEHTRRVNTDVLTSLEAGRPIELSTGLFTDNYPAAPKSTHNTPFGPKPYDFVARNYRPDHVAILPNQIGACSVQDGCGVLVNKNGVVVNEAQAKSLFSRFWEWVTANYGHKPCDEYEDDEDREDCEDEQGTNNAHPNQPRSKVTGKLKPLSAGVGKGDAHEAAQAGFIALTDEDSRLGCDAHKQLQEAGNNPASWVEDEDKWEKAKEAADKGDYGEGEQYWSVVTHIYKKMGGGVKESSSTTNLGVVDPKTICTTTIGTPAANEGDDMAFVINLDTDLLTNEELGANREFGSDEERRAAFAAMSDAGGGGVSTAEMKRQGGGGPESHTGRGGSTSGGGGGGTQSHTGKGGAESAVGGGRGATKSEGGGGKSALRQAAKDASAHAVERTSAAKKAGGKNQERAARQHRVAWNAHLDAATAHEQAGSHDLAAHHLKAADEHLSRAKHYEGTHNRFTMTNNERQAIVGRLISNGCACHNDRDSLLALSDRSLVGLYTANAPGEGTAFRKKGDMSFEGDEGTSDHELGVSDPDAATEEGLTEDTLDEQGNPIPPKKGMPDKGVKYPTGNQRGSQQQRTGTTTQGGGMPNRPLTNQEWMAIAPPDIRSAVQNAMEIEKAERLKLVQRLIANVADPNQRKAMAGRLMAKPIGELRDLLVLVPNANGQTGYAPPAVPLFTGAAGGPVGNQYIENDEDDTLPLPTINWAEDPFSTSGSRGKKHSEYAEAE